MKKYLTPLLVILLILACSTAVMAAGSATPTEIAYRNIEIIIDGNELIPRDVDGNATEPFIINGTTYLPVRAVANGLGLDVAWEDSTSTITLSSGGRIDYGYGKAASSFGKKDVTLHYRDIKLVIDGKQITPVDVNGKVVEPFIINGTTYLPIRAVGTALGAIVNWYAETNTVELRQYVQTQSISTITEDGKSRISDYSYTSTYDERGNQLSLIYHDGDYWKTTYNDKNDVLTEESLFSFSDDDRILEKEVNTYDANGRLSKKETTVEDTSEGKTVRTLTETVYTYDNSGNCILESSRNAADSPEGSMEVVRTFDARGNCLTETSRESFVEDGVPGTYTLAVNHSYDAQGREISYKNQSVTEVGDVNEENVYATTYTYDEMGNELNCHMTMSKKEYGITVNTFTRDVVSTYDVKGNLLSQASILVELEDGGTSLITRIESRNRYDENNQLIEEETLFFYPDGSVYRYLTTYTYNEKGRLTKSVETVTDTATDADTEDHITVTTSNYTYGANGRDCTIDSVCSDGSKERTVETYQRLSAK